MSLLATFSLASSQSARAPSSRNSFASSSLVRGSTLQTSLMYTDRGSLGSWVFMRVASPSSITVETRRLHSERIAPLSHSRFSGFTFSLPKVCPYRSGHEKEAEAQDFANAVCSDQAG